VSEEINKLCKKSATKKKAPEWKSLLKHNLEGGGAMRSTVSFFFYFAWAYSFNESDINLPRLIAFFSEAHGECDKGGNNNSFRELITAILFVKILPKLIGFCFSAIESLKCSQEGFFKTHFFGMARSNAYWEMNGHKIKAL